MPKILRRDLYKAVFSIATSKFKDSEFLKRHERYEATMDVGTPLYRYVSYRQQKPQEEEAGRKIWTPLVDDINNRWTGNGSAPGDEPHGSQGLYLSGMPHNSEMPFPELEHYQDRSAPPDVEVEYFEYAPGKEPKKVKVKASELRSHFLFTLIKPLKGIDFRLTVDNVENLLLTEILEEVKKKHPGVIHAEDNFKSLYTSSEDASLDRAIGNALFLATDREFFKVSSVRDLSSVNIILKGKQKILIDALKPLGRATFLIDPITKKSKGIDSIINDMYYNDTLSEYWR